MPVSVAGNPEVEAQQLIETVWAGQALPVDPIRIAAQLGIKVFRAELEPTIAGMLIKEPAKDPEVYLNQSDSPSRQRFSCAHELGHYVKRVAAGAEQWATIDYRGRLTPEGADPDEIYANQFAASLLMPKREVLRLHKDLGVAALAYEFGVSEEAMNYRLASLDLR